MYNEKQPNNYSTIKQYAEPSLHFYRACWSTILVQKTAWKKESYLTVEKNFKVKKFLT
jgi:hypothetical protein